VTGKTIAFMMSKIVMRKDVKSTEAAVKVVHLTKVFTVVNALKDTS